MLTDPKPDNKKKFNSEAFKYAIGMLESSGGKNLTNPNSSASGKYHFLWRYIKNDPLLKGKSQREFIANPELQEQVMDSAINGKLKGFPNYNSYSRSLKAKYNSDLPQESIAALTHFLGRSGVASYLKNKSYKVPGKVNLTAEGYAEKFNKYMQDYSKQNSNSSNVPSNDYVGIRGNADQSIRDIAVEASKKQIDNTRVSKANFNPPTGLETPNNMPASDSKSMTNFDPPTGLKTPNNFKYGSELDGDAYVHGGELDRFENGGTHEENPLGGIPQGIGANGKPNLVEEGETKWNDYVFSNSISMDGTFTDGNGNSMNIFKNGGPLDPDPSPKKEVKPLTLTKQNHPTSPSITEEIVVPDVREENMIFDGPVLEKTVDFKSRNTGAGTDAFLKRYNDPVTRQRLKDQAGLSDADIDNMILKGMRAEKQVGGNTRGSKASYSNDKIFMGEDYQDNVPVESHERVHASNIDAAMGLPLTNLLGNSFHQEGKSFLKKNSPETLRYLNQPHEAYGNFNEFRESLGMEPGEQIDKARLKKLVKEKGLGMENFYRAYNDDKIIEALNTIAHQEKNKNNFDNYRLS